MQLLNFNLYKKLSFLLKINKIIGINMQINDEFSNNKYMIKKCSEEGININHNNYKKSVLINLRNIISPWKIDNIKDLKNNHLLDIIKIKPKILIIGSGKNHIHINNKLFFTLYSNNIGCEIMNTYAACRTYNLLAIDNRNICAILLPI